MPLYLIALGVKRNPYRRVSRLVECKDLDSAVRTAQQVLEHAQHLNGLKGTYDKWTVSEPMPTRTARILATGPDDDQ